MTRRPESENQACEGATMTEYVLLLALLAVICIAALRFMGQTVSGQFSNATDIVLNYGAA